MYANPDYKQGYEDAMDGKPMRDDPSRPYKTGWQARKDFAEFLTKAGWVEPDGNWFPGENLGDEGN
ncbi:MAG: hypothetical protein O7G83_15470 [Proteobacteria bacterium]|nr:hypothetical protein [Pseudomonadota bacterium]